jgi:hypothetical protein
MYALIFSTRAVWSISQYRMNLARLCHKCTYEYVGLHVQHRLFFSYFNQTWTFSDRFSKYAQLRKFIKIRPVRAELFRADGQTDRTKQIVALHNLNSRNEITRGLLGPDSESIAVRRNAGNCLLVDMK